MDLALKMFELMKTLGTKGFLGLKFPEIRASCSENWTADYAIVDAAYADTFALEMEYEGFDQDDYDSKFERYLKDFFGPGVEVNYRRGCHEIEVYPKKDEPAAIVVDAPFPPLHQHEKRVIPNSEVAKAEHYADMAELARIFGHQVVETSESPPVWRWRQNGLVRWVTAEGNPNRLDLNRLWSDFHRGHATVYEMMKFYMQLGYSLCGFAEVFGQCEAWDWKLPDAQRPTNDGDAYTETPIMYVLRVAGNKHVRV